VGSTTTVVVTVGATTVLVTVNGTIEMQEQALERRIGRGVEVASWHREAIGDGTVGVGNVEIVSGEPEGVDVLETVICV
jgi:hypothetical protein